MFFIAIPSNGDRYSVLPEEFMVRANAEKFAKRRGLKNYFIATEAQRLLIESNDFSTDTSASNATWMKDDDIPGNKKQRKAQKK